MHSSHLGSIVINCDTFDAGVAFWSGGLGAMAQWPADPDDLYVSLGQFVGGLRVLLQRVPSRRQPRAASGYRNRRHRG
jgi:hypothetical protein